MELTTLNLFIASLAVWRLSSLVANEPGAFNMFGRFRDYARHLTRTNRFWRAFKLWHGTICEWCNSVWMAAGVVALLGWHPLTILTLSALAILFKYVIGALKNLEALLHKASQEQEGYMPVQAGLLHGVTSAKEWQEASPFVTRESQ